MLRTKIFCIAAAFLTFPLCAQGEIILDLTIGGMDPPQGTINGGIFGVGEVASGTGNFGVFQSVTKGAANEDRQGTPLGYNTAAGSSSLPWDTHSQSEALLFGNATIVMYDNAPHFEFLVDTREPQNGTKSTLSLDEVKIFQSDSGTLNSEDLSQLGSLLWDMDAGGAGNTVLLETAPGSGTSDNSLLVPLSAFSSAPDPTKYLTFYTSYGKYSGAGSWEIDSSFTEWGIKTGDGAVTYNEYLSPSNIPEPTSLMMFGAALAFGSTRRRRRS
jgi:hypothetical protein